MGLDAYAYTVPKDARNTAFAEELVGSTTEIAYWRKFHELHDWMEDTACAQGWTRGLNLVYFRLSVETLDELERYLASIWPDEDEDEDEDEEYDCVEMMAFLNDMSDTQAFIIKARDAINDGLDVYYWSWA